MPRYFTVEEANAALEVIRPIVEQILEIRQLILDKQIYLKPVLDQRKSNGGSRTASQAVRDFERLESLIREIQEAGALLKDLNTGLLDFPAMRDGREVYLCWQYGEDQIRYWHPIDGGFAGRQPL
jgi:hypothetical protein